MTRVPAWFSGAIASPVGDHVIDVEGCPIHYRQWGDPSAPGIVLVHGGAAHAHWWDFIAPHFTPGYLVAALDLSGHGDSGHREEYHPETWAAEVMAVAAAAGMSEPVVIGHSLGGMVTVVAANRYGGQLRGAIVVDTPVRRPDPESDEGIRGRSFANPKTYPDLETAVDHFHLVPPQPCENDFIVQHIARHSVHETPAGWTWKFDRNVFERRHTSGIEEYLGGVTCRVALLHGEMSALVTEEVQRDLDRLLGSRAPMAEIPQAHHHVPLDQPLALVAALRAFLADWQHTVPTPAG
jgi:pimeloyl-ACP methyl ester carboxylesterase